MSTDLIHRGDAADGIHDRRIFPTCDELGLAPLLRPHRHDDLGRIRVVDRDSDEGRAILADRATRKARRDRINGLSDGEDLALAALGGAA